MGVAAPSPFLLLTLPDSLSSPFRSGGSEGRGPGVGGKVRSPGSHPPPASLGAGALWAGPSRPLWALCPPPASRLGEGSRGSSHMGPSPSHPPGAGRGPAAAA